MTAPSRFDRFLDRVPVLGRFRRVRGYKSMAVLLANVDAYDARLAGKTEAA